MKTPTRYLSMLLAAFAVLVASALPVRADDLPIVRAILFYSPSCPHCHTVIDEVLPPLFDQYGDQLQILGVNVATEGGQALYQAAIAEYNVPPNRLGVPALLIGDLYLVGSLEIPEQLPGLIETHLANGGLGWPALTGLQDALPPEYATSANPGGAPAAEAVVAPPPTVSTPVPSLPEQVLANIQRDPAGNTLSILLLAAMLIVVAVVASRLVLAWRARPDLFKLLNDLPGWRSWAIAALCLAGIGISAYMAYVETTQTAAVCGPVGDCNTVQQSEFATLFGVLPIGVVGVWGYAAMFALWLVMHFADGTPKRYAETVLFGLAAFGTLFSIYLTFLEPFVIGATCAWCLSSALAMTLILVLMASALPAPAQFRHRTPTPA